MISPVGFHVWQVTVRRNKQSYRSPLIVQFLFFLKFKDDYRHEYAVSNFVTQIIWNLLLMKLGKPFCSQHTQIGHAVSTGRSR